jgi:hypothetical protein
MEFSLGASSKILVQRRRDLSVRSEVLAAVAMKSTAFWDVTPCSSESAWRFGGTYRLHLQDRRVNQGGNQEKPAAILPFGPAVDLSKTTWLPLSWSGCLRWASVQGPTSAALATRVLIVACFCGRQFTDVKLQLGPGTSLSKGCPNYARWRTSTFSLK